MSEATDFPHAGQLLNATKGHDKIAGVGDPDSSAGHFRHASDGQGCLAGAAIPAIDLIRAAHRQRCFAMETRKMLYLRLGAMIRMELGWRKDLPERERKAIAAQAQKMIDEETGPCQNLIIGTKRAAAVFEIEERATEKLMGKLAKQLPVWEAFGRHVRGFGELRLAVIVAEAGDLAGYDREAQLWKRMGLAPGQSRLPKGLSREQAKAAWIERGYNPRRRSEMWVIGDVLIKGNRDGKYRTMYLARKEYERARDPKMTKMHAHRRAQHYMEKRLLRDLWRAWRRPNHVVPQLRPISKWPAPVIEECAAGA